MATMIIQSLQVAVESVFGSIAATTGQPDISGLTFAALEYDRADGYSGQATQVNPRNDARVEAYVLPAEPVTIFSGANRVARRQGEMSVRFPLRTIGSASTYATYALMPMGKLFNSCLGAFTPAASSVTADSNVSATEFNAAGGTGGNLLDGVLFKADNPNLNNAVAEFSAITQRSTDALKHSPAVSSDWITTDVVRTCQMYYAALGGFSVMPTVALRFDASGRRWEAAGCRLSSLTISPSDYEVMCDATIRMPYIVDADGSTDPVDPTRADGQIAHALGAESIYSAAIGTTTPAELARTAYDASAWSVTFTPVLAAVGSTNDIIGIADLEVTDWAAEVSVTTTPSEGTVDSDLRDMLLNQQQRQLLLGCGPVGTGNGAAILIPAATALTDGLMSEGDDVREVMNLQFGAGQWSLDSSATAPGDTNFRIGLSL